MKSIYGSDQSFSNSLNKLFNKLNYPIFKYETLNLAIIVHNCGGKHPNSKMKHSNEPIQINYLDLPEVAACDLVVIGFQEIVEMKGKNLTNIVTNFNASSLENWMKFFQGRNDYYIISQASILGIMIVVLLKKHSKSKFKVSITGHSQVRQGFMNITANKGGIYMQLLVNNNKIGLYCVHLAAGNGLIPNQQRISGLREFMKVAKEQDDDAAFYFGDMNFRNNSSQDEIVNKINKYKTEKNQGLKNSLLQDLLQSDDLISYRKTLSPNDNFHNLLEGKINFLPSYKFELDTGEYDLDHPKKKPSWTDRILYQCSDLGSFQLNSYNTDRDTLFSDHL